MSTYQDWDQQVPLPDYYAPIGGKSTHGYSRSVRLDALYWRACMRLMRRGRVSVMHPCLGRPEYEALELCRKLWEAAGRSWPRSDEPASPPPQ